MSNSVSLDMLNNFLMLKTQTLTLSQSLTLTLSFSHSLSLSEHLLFSCVCSKITVYSRKLQCFTVTLSHSHTFTLPFSHSLILSFILSWHAEQLLFSCVCSKVTVYSRKLQCFFFTSASSSPDPVTLFRVHRAGSQLKISKIPLFGELKTVPKFIMHTQVKYARYRF